MPRVATYDLSRYDWILLGASVMLVVFGLSALYSTSLAGANPSPYLSGAAGAVQPDFGNFWKQFWFAIVGILVALAAPAIDYRTFARMNKFLFVLSVVLLAAVLVFGATIRGTKGWFGIAGFGIQPVEIVKLLLIFFLAKYFSDRADRVKGIRHILVSGAAVAVPVVLVMMQPDFGSALLLLAVWGSLALVSGIRRSHLALLALAFVAVSAFAWMFVLKPYQKDRVIAFLDPESDPLGRGYNVTQSVIAIGSGGWTGKGMGYGSQSQLRFLPERQTDFIFAVIAEELGFLGVLFLCGLFVVVFWRGYRLVRASRDDFTLYLALGISVSLALEVFVNLGGNLRLIPVTGITLPFVSYGGSSLIAKFLMIGVLQSIAMRNQA